MKKLPNPLNQIKIVPKIPFVLQPISWLKDIVQALEKKIGSGEFRFLNDEIQKYIFSDGIGNQNTFTYEYMGNFTIAEKTCPSQVKQYKEDVKQMCCGIMEFEVGPSKAGKIYLVAFDYGH